MRVFDKLGSFSSKVNFADENNVLVGFDTDQQCCEKAGYYWTLSEPFAYDRSPPQIDPDLSAYSFDIAWFREVDDLQDDLDSGQAVAFRCIASGLPDLYLVLFNAHNGYYSHGFEVNVGGQVTRSGSL